MSTRRFRGSPNWKNGIPAHSSIRIEVLPQQTPVYVDTDISEEVAVNLDPGYYHVGIKKFLGKNAMGRLSQLRWEERFFHDVTEQEYMVLAAMRPLRATGRLLSRGFIFFCGYAPCEYSCNNSMAMVLHELEKHRDVTREDLVKNSDYLIDQNLSEAPAPVQEQPTDAPKRGRGRPRSFNSSNT